MKNKFFLIVSVLIVVVTLSVFSWYVKNQKTTNVGKPLTKEEDNQENIINDAEESADVDGLLTYRNEEYGFEFKYPNNIEPISFSREKIFTCAFEPI